MRASLALALALGVTMVSADEECKFQANLDYDGGTQNEHAPATTKEECCAQCRAHDDCAAGVWSPPDATGTCWYKDKVAVLKPSTPGGGKTSMACTVNPDWVPPVRSSGPSAGDVFVLCVCCVGVVYLGGGLALGFAQGRAKGGGSVLDQHPHSAFLRQTAMLVADGMRWTARGGRGYKPIAGVGAPMPQKVSGSKSAKKAKKEKKPKGDKKDKKRERRESKSRRESSTSIGSSSRSSRSSRSKSSPSSSPQSSRGSKAGSPAQLEDTHKVTRDATRDRGTRQSVAELREETDDTVHSSMAKVKVLA